MATKVTDKAIQKKFDDAKKQVEEAQGGKFSDALTQAGLTEKSFKKQLKQAEAMQVGLERSLENYR